MSNHERIGIVGAGRFGLAMAAMLGRAERPVLLWSQDSKVVNSIARGGKTERMPDLALPKSVEATLDARFFAESVRFMVIAVSSEQIRERMKVLGEVVSGQHLAVHAIGAFCAPDDLRVSQVVFQETPMKRIGVISGPSMASDIVASRGTSLLCASPFDEVTRESKRLLGVSRIMRLYRSKDMIGAELASALSLVYTITIGLADGLNVGVGVRSVLLTRSVSEMIKLGVAAGAEAQTFAGLAGLGNLLVRSSVEEGRMSPSYRLGKEVVDGKFAPAGRESVRATHAGVRLARSLGLYLPVLETTALVLAGKLSAQEAAAKLVQTVAEEE